MKMRFAVVLIVILSLFVYVGWRLADSLGAGWTVVVMLILFAGFISYRPLHRLKDRKLRLFLVNAVHLEMGFLSFLLTWIVLRDVVFVPLRFFNEQMVKTAAAWAYSDQGTGLVLGLSAVTLAVGVWIAQAGPWVVRVAVPIKDLPSDLEGFTIAQLSDMHIGPTTRSGTVEKIVHTTLSLKPSMIALTGDIGDGPVRESLEALEKLRGLSRVPCFYVTGNHEYYWNGPEWVSTFSSLGLTPLMNAYAVINVGQSELVVIGTPDPTARVLGAEAQPDVKRAMSRPIGRERRGKEQGSSETSKSVKILMAHQPGISNEAKAAGIDLQLSGHTHAGQFFPWTLVVKRVHEFSSGLGRTGSLWVYVNPGTGSWGPQVRLGTKTEITLLTLTKES